MSLIVPGSFSETFSFSHRPIRTLHLKHLGTVVHTSDFLLTINIVLTLFSSLIVNADLTIVQIWLLGIIFTRILLLMVISIVEVL